MDSETFKKKFLPFHPKLYRFAYHFLGRIADAEDAVQETYLKLWDRREKLGLIDNPEAFCMVLIRNICIDMLRSPGRKKEECPPIDTASEKTPAGTVESTDELEYIGRLIGSLPDNQREVMILRHLDDRSMKEIETITGLSPVNIRVLLSRARKAIRAQFEKQNEK